MSEETVLENNSEGQPAGAERSFNKKGGFNRFYKKKVCKFCSTKSVPSYKEFDFLKKFTTEKGKILPARITGTCAKHQRALATEIKKARYMALVPFVKD